MFVNGIVPVTANGLVLGIHLNVFFSFSTSLDMIEYNAKQEQ